ncbi:MAG TPA: signal peptidase II [Gemmatimonadetes bacterium]|nr:signal peptidase II [Gemmatimonadota bacterium]HIC62923.1 signal peptidase II [Gemmatimonadota bacterium]
MSYGRLGDVRLKLVIFALTFSPIIILDLVTKRWALEALSYSSSQLLGGLIPLTLAFNKGAAFGISIGDDSRWFFVPVTIVALALLGGLLKQASKNDLLKIFSISLVISGALGNLYDRVRWSRGVVDFIGPIDLGRWDFPIFNVADMAISCGAILLAISFWMEEQAQSRSRASEVVGQLDELEPLKSLPDEEVP